VYQIADHWNEFELSLSEYHKKCFVIKGWKELFEKINEHLTSLGVMRHSPYYAVFESDASLWEDRLTRMSTMFDVWVAVQRRYVYLEVILFMENALAYI